MANKNSVAEPESVDTFAGTTEEENFEDGFGASQDLAYEKEMERRTKAHADPTMDPSNPKWNPKRYFSRQPKVTITIARTESDVLSDPRHERKITVPVSINGYRLDIEKGVPTRVPEDFARHLVDIGAAYRQADAVEAKEV